MKNKNLNRYYNLTTNSLVSTTIELILVNIMLLYKSGRSITTLTTYWKKCQISTFTFRPYGPTNNMCKSKATFWINMVLFQSLICFKFNFFTFNLFGFWSRSLLQRAYVWLLSPVSGSVTRTGLVVHGLELITDFAGAPPHIGTQLQNSAKN